MPCNHPHREPRSRFEITSGRGNVTLLHYILRRGGVELNYGEPLALSRAKAPTYLYVPITQPYGRFAKAILKQRYPDLRDAEGHPIAPYDVTAQTLPLLMGVALTPVFLRFAIDVAVSDETELEYYGREGRVALYKSHVPALDEGWSRWVLQQNGRTQPSTNMDTVIGSGSRNRFPP
jgi:hypothetical protein